MAGDEDEFVALFNTGTVIEDWSNGEFEFRDGFLYYEDEQVASQPTERIINMLKNGWDHKPMLAILSVCIKTSAIVLCKSPYTWCSHKDCQLLMTEC